MNTNEPERLELHLARYQPADEQRCYVCERRAGGDGLCEFCRYEIEAAIIDAENQSWRHP